MHVRARDVATVIALLLLGAEVLRGRFHVWGFVALVAFAGLGVGSLLGDGGREVGTPPARIVPDCPVMHGGDAGGGYPERHDKVHGGPARLAHRGVARVACEEWRLSPLMVCSNSAQS
jgi:hypothetical protein